MAKNNERKKIKQTNNNKNAQKHNSMEKKVTNYGFQNFLGKKKADHLPIYFTFDKLY